MAEKILLDCGDIREEWEDYHIGDLTVPEGKCVTVTDPCYDNDPSPGIQNIDLPAGRYAVLVDTKDTWGMRTSKITLTSIRHYEWLDRAIVGEAYVDAGLCGFFVDKPNYDDAPWSQLCKEMFGDDLKGRNIWFETKEGFFCISGYGDGAYPVYAYYDEDGEIKALQIVFIPDEDDEDEDEDEWDEDDDY